MQHAQVYLEDQEYIALCDLLKLAGLADTGGQAKAIIAAGEVLRNGTVETRKTAKIRAGEWIEYAGCKLEIYDGYDPEAESYAAHTARRLGMLRQRMRRCLHSRNLPPRKSRIRCAAKRSARKSVAGIKQLTAQPLPVFSHWHFKQAVSQNPRRGTQKNIQRLFGGKTYCYHVSELVKLLKTFKKTYDEQLLIYPQNAFHNQKYAFCFLFLEVTI